MAEYNPGDGWLWLEVEANRIIVFEFLELRFRFVKLRFLLWKLCCFCWLLKLDFVVREQIGVRVAIGGASELWCVMRTVNYDYFFLLEWM